MKCEYCGRPVRSGDRKCEGCYAPLPDEATRFDQIVIVSMEMSSRNFAAVGKLTDVR